MSATKTISSESSSSSGSSGARLWAHPATFGALWGALEATVGSFVHAVKMPFGGTMLAASGAALLLALRVMFPRRGVIIAAGAVCAFVKLVAPSTMILGPMIGILVEAVLIELACLPFGAPICTLFFTSRSCAKWKPRTGLPATVTSSWPRYR